MRRLRVRQRRINEIEVQGGKKKSALIKRPLSPKGFIQTVLTVVLFVLDRRALPTALFFFHFAKAEFGYSSCLALHFGLRVSPQLCAY